MSRIYKEIFKFVCDLAKHELQSSACVANCATSARLISLFSASRDASDMIRFLRLGTRSLPPESHCSGGTLLFGQRSARHVRGNRCRPESKGSVPFFRKYIFYLVGGLPHCQLRCLPLLFLLASHLLALENLSNAAGLRRCT